MKEAETVKQLEDKLVGLESRLAFQDDTIQALNKIVVQQQQQMDLFAKHLQHLSQQLRDLKPSDIGPESEEVPPPHY